MILRQNLQKLYVVLDRSTLEYSVQKLESVTPLLMDEIITIYAPMIYTAPCIMFRANPFRGEVGGGWALEFARFLGPVMAKS